MDSYMIYNEMTDGAQNSNRSFFIASICQKNFKKVKYHPIHATDTAVNRVLS